MSAVISRKVTSITLSADVLSEARRLGINISKVCDTSLREVVRRELQKRWQQENAAAIAAYNQLVESEGLPLEDFRQF